MNESKIERRYIGALTVGKTSKVLDRICQAVKSCQQTRTIPLIKVEKKPRGQFYVFLAIEGIAGDPLPEPIRNVLRLSGLKNYIWVTPNDIKDMTGSGEIETQGFHTLAYQPLWDRHVGDPFDLPEDLSDAHHDEAQQQSYDRLLYWLSAVAEGSWEMFVGACKALRLTEDARRILRRLVLLGHLECAKDGSKWSVAPPALALHPTQPDVGFLCGQRTPRLLARLREFGSVTETPQPFQPGPARIEIAGELDACAAALNLHPAGAVAMRLAELLPSANEWQETLARIEKPNTHTCHIERWDGRQYADCPDFYQRDDEYHGASGLYRLTREANAFRLALYFDAARQRWLKGDWYGLRFLASQSAGLEQEPVHQSTTNELRVLAAERWPLLYERALALASGLLPQRATDNAQAAWLVYRDIPAALTGTLAQKLNLQVKEHSRA